MALALPVPSETHRENTGSLGGDIENNLLIFIASKQNLKYMLLYLSLCKQSTIHRVSTMLDTFKNVFSRA